MQTETLRRVKTVFGCEHINKKNGHKKSNVV